MQSLNIIIFGGPAFPADKRFLIFEYLSLRTFGCVPNVTKHKTMNHVDIKEINPVLKLCQSIMHLGTIS